MTQERETPTDTGAEYGRRVLQSLTDAALFVNAMRASLPTSGTYGAGTSRVLGDSFDAWAGLLTRAGAPGLPPAAQGEDDGGGAVVPTPSTMGADLASIALLAQEQGQALSQWVAGAGDAARERFRIIATTFGSFVDVVRARIEALRGATSDAAARVRAFLQRWAEGAMRVHRDMMGALGRAASGFGMVVGAGLLLYIWSKRRG